VIVITVEGGIVRGVSSDDPADRGKQVVVIDYDAEGADPEEVVRVPQGKGEKADAIVSAQEVGVLYGPVARFLRAGRGKGGHGNRR